MNHALSNKFKVEGRILFYVLIFEAFCFSEASRVIFRENAGNSTSKSVLNFEFDMSSVLECDAER